MLGRPAALRQISHTPRLESPTARRIWILPPDLDKDWETDPIAIRRSSPEAPERLQRSRIERIERNRRGGPQCVEQCVEEGCFSIGCSLQSRWWGWRARCSRVAIAPSKTTTAISPNRFVERIWRTRRPIVEQGSPNRRGLDALPASKWLRYRIASSTRERCKR